MGVQRVSSNKDAEAAGRATQAVLRDLSALDQMLQAGQIEAGFRRIGAEQELILVDRSLRPAPVATEVIERIGDDRVVPELGMFNVEFNCDPIDAGPDCIDVLEGHLTDAMRIVSDGAEPSGAEPLMTGVCPTLELAHLRRQYMAPSDRYTALDEMLRRLRGSDYELRIEGPDELLVRHPSVMLEAANTSFQVHYQSDPERFPDEYNVSLAVAGPLLAACANSPVLFGKRLWRETRIAIFQQVVDTRSTGAGHREMPARVRFGESWVERSILEIFRADVARFRHGLVPAGESTEDPLELLERGELPKLRALQAFNSCVYRWMRPCFGVSGGVAHIRIENRVLPAGPTIADEVAGAAFWIGLVSEGPHAWPGLTERMDFRDARSNFLSAAQRGLACHLTWLDGVERPARELLESEFIPVARRGLERFGVDSAAIERTMSVIERRVSSGRTGAKWLLDSAASLHGRGTRAQRLGRLTREMLEGQKRGDPVHTWELAAHEENARISSTFATVSQCMSTDLFTVEEDEPIDLVASIMDWEHLRHIPVENEDHQLVGLISYRELLRLLARAERSGQPRPIRAADVMVPDPVTASPDMPSAEAIRLMCEKKVSCLPVVEEGRLVGVVSERDYTEIARDLLERALAEDVDE
ncbi:MAG: CBS domain-containing protein [Planctomycetota bacterium]